MFLHLLFWMVSKILVTIPPSKQTSLESQESYWRGIDPARPLETAFPYARGVARRGVALAYVACWGCKAHLGGPTQAGLQGYLVSSVRCPQGVTVMDTRNGAFEIFEFSVDFYIFPLHVESTRVRLDSVHAVTEPDS